jgi:hypothetical protein
VFAEQAGQRAFGEAAAIGEHVDAVGHVHHQPHVVLDEQDRGAVLANVLQQLAQRQGFGCIHPGRRFVQGEQFWLGCKRARDFQAALVAVGQAAREIVLARAHADVLEQVARAGVDGPLFVARVTRAQHRAEHARHGAHVAADHHIFQRGHVAE